MMRPLLTVLALLAACSSKTPSDAPMPRGGAPAIEDSTQAGEAPSSHAGAPNEPAPHVFSIEFDYRFDTAGYFDEAAHPERRAALEAAAATWSALIDEDFLEVPSDTRLRINDPENRDEERWVDGVDHDIDDVLVFVGTSEAIVGYGRGGPALVAESTDSTLNQSFENRVNGRRFEPWAGSISFKGSVDYFFDETPDRDDDLPADAYDFISLATHELGHVLGFTPCAAFDAQEKDGTFVGESAVREHGEPVPLTDDHQHFADGTSSSGDEALMTPKLQSGVRRLPTPLDVATFRDLGYAVKE